MSDSTATVSGFPLSFSRPKSKICPPSKAGSGKQLAMATAMLNKAKKYKKIVKLAKKEKVVASIRAMGPASTDSEILAVNNLIITKLLSSKY